MERTVAVVDDEPRILSLYATWLEEEYDVVRAGDGAAALDVVDDSVDVVLLDRRMPDLSGDEVLARLRDRGYDGWVVLVTAVDPDLDLADLPLDDYLVKPVDRETLLEAVETVVAREAYDEQLQAYFRSIAKLGVLETELETHELVASEEYANLEAENRRIKERLSELGDELDETGPPGELFLEPPSESVRPE